MHTDDHDMLDTKIDEVIHILDDLMQVSTSKNLFIERKSRGRHLFWNEWVIDQPRQTLPQGSKAGALLSIDEVYSSDFLDLVRSNVGGELSPRLDCTLSFSDKRLMRGHVRMSNTIEEIKAWLEAMRS